MSFSLRRDLGPRMSLHFDMAPDMIVGFESLFTFLHINNIMKIIKQSTNTQAWKIHDVNPVQKLNLRD